MRSPGLPSADAPPDYEGHPDQERDYNEHVEAVECRPKRRVSVPARTERRPYIGQRVAPEP